VTDAESAPPGSPSPKDSPPAASSSSGDSRPPESILRNTGFALATQIATAAFTAGLTIFLARELGPDEFGVFSLALGIGALLVLPGDAGISGAAARYIAERRGDGAAAKDVLRHASRLRLVTSGTVCVAMIVAAGPIADAYDAPTLAWALRGMAVAVFGQNLMQLYGSAFTALGRLSLSFRMTISKSVVEVAASVGLVLAGAGAAGAAFGRAAGYLAGGALGVVVIQRLLRSRTHTSASPVRMRQLAGYAGALLVIEGAFVVFEQVDVLLIGALISTSAAGLFQAPLRLITFLHYPGYALASGVAPRVAKHELEGSQTGAFEGALRLIVLFQAALIAPLVIWATPLVDLLLGSDYAESADVLRALAPFVFLSGIGPLVSMAVNYLGEARRRIPIAIAAVVVNVAIDLVLIPEMGITGAAIGTNVAYAIYVPAHLWICHDLIGLHVGRLCVSTVRALAAGAVMAAVLAAFGTSEVAVPLLVAGGALGTCAYVATLLALRELSPDEIRRGWAMRRRLLPSRP
jgi:O-antigen/teichoic acid export membrane protein